MTKAQKVAMMNEELGNIRMTSNLMVIGVDATQAIALDELFSKDERKTTRMTRVTTRQTRKTGADSKVLEGKIEEEEEELEVPTTVMRGAGLCKGKIGINLFCMIWLWSATIVDYFVINIYLKYIPGSEFLNQTIAGVSEIMAHIVVGGMITYLSPKGTFVIGYILAAMGGACLIFQNTF
jgi:hypothetical protein